MIRKRQQLNPIVCRVISRPRHILLVHNMSKKESVKMMCYSCMKCDVYHSRMLSNKCQGCGCLGSQHKSLDQVTMPGFYLHRGQLNSQLTWNQIQKLNEWLDPWGWFPLKGVQSLTLDLAKKQFEWGKMGIASLILSMLISPVANLGSVAVHWIHFYASLTFAIACFIAYRTCIKVNVDHYSSSNTKKVVAVILFSINGALCCTYGLSALGLSPKLMDGFGQPIVKPMRYMGWLIAYPTAFQLLFDVTTNSPLSAW